MQVAASPTTKVYRIHFAVRPEAGGDDGVVDAFLPRDRPMWPGGLEPATAARVRVTASDEASDRAAVFAALRAAREAGATVVEIAAPPPRVPRTGVVLDVVDLALRAGLPSISFVGTALPTPPGGGRASLDVATRAWLETYVRGLPDHGAAAAVAVDGARLPAERAGVPPRPLPPPPARRPRAPAGGEAGGGVPDVGVPLEEEPVEEGAYGEPGAVDGSTPVVGERAFPDLPTVEDGAAGARAAEAERRRSLGRTDAPGRAQAARAVEAALAWLAAHQTDDGSWSAAHFGAWCDGVERPAPSDGAGKPAYDTGVTALALLAFLGAGHVDRGGGPYASVVGRALRWLVRAQDAEGCFGPRSDPHAVYGHALATLAVVDAYALTGEPRLRRPAQRSLDFVALSRNPYRAWRYGVKPGDDDTSVTAWMTLALAAARDVADAERARGAEPTLVLDLDAFDGARSFVDAMTDPATGRVGYQQRGGGPARPPHVADRFPASRSEATTAAGVLVRLLAGESPPASEAVRKGLARVSGLPPRWREDAGAIDFSAWHHASLALHRVGGDAWGAWWAALVDAVVPRQRTEGTPCDLRGSFDPVDPWGPEGGRVYATALLALTLETPTRARPTAAAAAGR